MKRLFLLLSLACISSIVFAIEKVRFFERPAVNVSQSDTIVEGRQLVSSFYSPYISSQDSAFIVVNIEIDGAGKVVSAKIDSTSVFGTSRHSAQWLADAHIAAAKKFRFNQSTTAIERQKGKIMYIIRPKD